MYISDRLKQKDNETFSFEIEKDRDFRILQLTDLHMGFGFLSRKKDRLAMTAIRTLIEETRPHMIVLT